MIKSYTVYFTKSVVGKDGKKRLNNLLSDGILIHKSNFPAISITENDQYQIRDLKLTGTSWTGVFGKLRDDAPHVIDQNNNESELDLIDGQKLIEKCHFLFKQNVNILVWQTNRSAGSLNRFQIYLSQLFDEMVSLPMIMNQEGLDRILAGDLYEISFHYDRPNALFTGKRPKWSKEIFNMLNDVRAAHGKFELRAERNSSLGQKAKTMVQTIFGMSETDKIRVRLTDDSDPIKLFLAPETEKIEVELKGRYPDSGTVYVELQSAYDRKRNILIPSDDA